MDRQNAHRCIACSAVIKAAYKKVVDHFCQGRRHGCGCWWF